MKSKFLENNTAVFLILLACVLACFGNALFNRFVWDDGYLIVENPYIKNFHYFTNLFKGDVTASTVISHMKSQYYRPLSMLSFMTDYHLWGLNPFGFHLTNMIIHWFNTLFVFLILSQINQNRMMGFLGAVIFAVHPIHVEAVTPIYNRMGIQTAFFMLAGFFLFMNSKEWTNLKALAAALVMFICALLSKENAVVLPFLFILYDIIYFSGKGIGKIFTPRRFYFYLSCFAIGVLYILIRQVAIEPAPVVAALGKSRALAPNLFSHLTTVLYLSVKYLAKALVPVRLSALYWIDPVVSLADLRFLLSCFALVSLLWIFRKIKSRNTIFFAGFFIITILPFTNIIPIGASYTFHERFLYLPSVAICQLFAGGVLFCRGKLLKVMSRPLIAALGAMLLSAICIYTATCNYAWASDLTLWRREVANDSDSQDAYLNLGQVYLDSGKHDQALWALNKSLSVSRPIALDGVYLAQINLANAYIQKNDYLRALIEAQKALGISEQMDLNPFALYDKLGLIYAELKEFKKAEENFQKALGSNPGFAVGHYNLGILYFENKQYKKAEEQLQTAAALDQDFFYASYALGLVLKAQNRFDEAAAAFRQTLQINPYFYLAEQQLRDLKD